MEAPSEEEKTLLQLMLQHGAPMVEHVLGRMSLEEFTEGPSRALAARLVELYEGGRVSPEPFLNGKYGEEVRDLTAGLLMPQHQVSENWERKYNIEVKPINGDAYAVANAVFLKHRKRLTLKTIRHVKHQIFLAGKDEQEVEALQMRLMELFAYMKELDPDLSISSDF